MTENSVPNKKRLLFVVEAMGGGVFTYIVNLTNRLVEEYDLYLAYAVRPQTPENYPDYFDKRIHLIKVKHFVRKVCPKEDLSAALELVEINRRVKPDIIHLHSSKAGVLGRLVFAVSKTPLFYTPHGYSFLMESMSRKKRLFYRLIESVLALGRCITISCSAGEHSETLKMTPRAELVNNGIDLAEMKDYLDEVQPPQTAHPFTVFTLGRICYQKNPVLFNQIAKSLPDVHFLWIGMGEDREQLAAPNIEVTGWTDRKTALRYAVQADAFLLPSRWEGLPISLLEAMYMKKPCVVSDVIGNHDVIHSGTNGFICQTAEDFTAAIRTIQTDSATAERLVAAAYQDVLQEYNIAVMAQNYAAIYEKTCQHTAVHSTAVLAEV